MKSKAAWLGWLVLATIMAVVPLVGAQDPDQDDVRGAFLTTRPKAADRPAASSTPAKPTHRRPKTIAKKNPPKDGLESSSGSDSSGSKDTKMARLGLGMTLFMRDSNGLAVRVDPNHDFKKGDRVRVLLETNADGNLYIFNTTDNGAPVMIYPSAQLDEGGNYIQAHVPFEIPSSLADEDRLRWFEFDGNAGVERLYFVFSREPLKNVPIDEELMKFCGEKKLECTWRPESQLWNSLQKELESPTRADNARKFGKAQTSGEQEATTRGIGLAKEDAEPTMVIMSASAGPNMLVTAMELAHK